jgi:hypothetical protein
VLLQQNVLEIIGGVVGFIIAIGLLWVLPIMLGVRAAREKNRSPHWMWFGIHPVTGLIAYLVLRFSKPRAIQPPPAAEPPVAETSDSSSGFLTQVQWGEGAAVARPRVIAVLAVLLIIGGLFDAVYLLTTFSQTRAGQTDSEALTLLHRDAVFHGWTMFSVWVGLLLAIPRFFVGLGLWRRRLWALMASVWLLWCTLASSAMAMIILNYVIWFRDVPREVMDASDEAKGQRFLIYLGGTITGLIVIGLSLFFIKRLRGEAVRAHFAESLVDA